MANRILQLARGASIRHAGAVAIALAVGTAGLLGPAAAQQPAPRNDAILKEHLRADLFFLAGDAMRGRLTNTEENRATADYIRSRFERMGLKEHLTPQRSNGFRSMVERIKRDAQCAMAAATA